MRMEIRYMPLDAMEVFMEFRTELKIMILTFFLSELQKHIAPEDAVILMQSGHEKLRYVTGFATVITSGGIETISIDELAISKAREMLKNIEYSPKMDY